MTTREPQPSRAFFSGSAIPLAAVLFLALLGVALILAGEAATDDSPTRAGPYGYLLLQAAGALGLLVHRKRAGIAAYLMGLIFAVNLILFVLIATGFVGPHIVIIALDLILLFVSGIIGAIAVVVALAWTISRSAKVPMVTAMTAAVIGSILVTGATGGGAVPAAITPAPSFSPPPRLVSPTPTASPTATPTRSPVRTFTLALRVAGNGSVALRAQGITCPPTCNIPFPEGTVASLTAVPASNSVLAGWTGCRTPCQVLMDRSRDVVATFRFPTLQVSVDGKGRGIVRSDPKGIDCPPTCEVSFARGTRMTLVASPEAPAVFTGWSEGCGGFGSCNLEIKSDSSARAQFEAAAGGGYAAKVCDSTGVQLRRGQTMSLTVSCSNDGSVTWTRGTGTEVELGQCCPLGGPSPLSEWGVGWSSDRVYADIAQTSVGPGSVASASFTIRAPANAAFGDYRFDGFLVQARTGAPVARGAFSIVVTVIP